VEYGFPLTIGRKETNHIVISNLAVSGTHAKVDYNPDGVVLSDLNSKNGTFVNGKTVRKCRLKEGDEIVIGKHKLVFSDANAGKRLPVGVAPSSTKTLDETMVLDTTKHRDMVSGMVKGPQQEEKPKAPIPVLAYIQGGEGRVVLKNKFTRIGKEETNDIIATGMFVGPRAATLTKQNDGYILAHVGGLSRIRINGRKVKSPQKLEHGDIVTLGKLTMKYLSKPKKTTGDETV
jgi:pSer/pThr/pTyr-binding forkhead associated (FHA) protein